MVISADFFSYCTSCKKVGLKKIYIGLKWHRSAGPAKVKFTPVRRESYQKLSAGPACISDPDVEAIKEYSVINGELEESWF